jgi:hypothetical protein
MVTVFAVLPMMIVVIRVSLRMPPIGRRRGGGRNRGRGRCDHRRRSLDDLIQFPAVEPYAATLWAVVDFYALPFRHDKVDF